MSRPTASRGVIASFLVAMVVLLTGCSELSARRLVQKGNGAYADQNYELAASYFERALAKAPDLDIAHHNLAITYARMFKPGLDTPANKELADKAANHFAVWLEKHPRDEKIRRLLTSLWIDAGDYERALAFWKKEHDANPKARDVIQLIGGIYLKSGDWRTALEWYQRDVDAAPDTPGKVSAYISITRLTFNKVFANRDKIIGAERVEIAGIGLEAAQKGIELDPNNLELWSMAGGLWNQASYANGQHWAMQIDRTEAQVYEQRARVLKEEAKKAQAAQGAGTPPATPSGTAPPSGNGT